MQDDRSEQMERDNVAFLSSPEGIKQLEESKHNHEKYIKYFNAIVGEARAKIRCLDGVGMPTGTYRIGHGYYSLQDCGQYPDMLQFALLHFDEIAAFLKTFVLSEDQDKLKFGNTCILTPAQGGQPKQIETNISIHCDGENEWFYDTNTREVSFEASSECGYNVNRSSINIDDLLAKIKALES